jgi:DNA invertase Pin-like site-specific DNA recombinase
MKAIGYIRVSTQKQADEGVSLDAQRAKIEAWCLANDYELAGIHCDEGISGTKSDRDGVLAAMAEAGKGTALIVYSLSRLTRSTKDLISFGDKLEKQGADLISLTEKIDTTTAAGKMVFRMLGVLNEFERDQVSERTKAALAHKKETNQVYNHTPYGYYTPRRQVDVGQAGAEPYWLRSKQAPPWYVLQRHSASPEQRRHSNQARQAVAANAGQPSNQEGCVMMSKELLMLLMADAGYLSWFADGANLPRAFKLCSLRLGQAAWLVVMVHILPRILAAGYRHTHSCRLNTTFLLLRQPPQNVQKLAAQNVQKHQGGHDLGGGGVLTHKLITIVAAQTCLS